MAGGKATTDMMDLLHGLMAEAMTEDLKRELETVRENGGTVSPKLYGVIRAFLKDNGIDAPASSPRFSPLVDQLRSIDVGDHDYGPS